MADQQYIATSTKPPAPIDPELLRGVRVSVEARLGRTDMTIAAMLALKAGSIVVLEASIADRVDLTLNDVVIARGEIVAVGDHFGIRIDEIGAG